MRVAVIAISALVAAACAPSASPPNTLAAVLVASELAVGEQRVPIGILEHKAPVSDAAVHLRAFRDSPSDPLHVEADAPFKGEGLLGRGVYVAHLTFGAAGPWIIEVTAQRPSRATGTTLLRANVTQRPSVPWIGDPAPASRNPTARDVASLAEIDSGTPPNDMHELSIADAIAQHRSAIVVFATPPFCTSAICGPQVRAVQALEPLLRDRVAFIHIEIYTDYRPDPDRRRITDTVLEWRLRSEPWVFVIDRDAIIRAAFEGPTATDEIRAAAERMLARP